MWDVGPNKNLDPVLWAPFNIAGLVVTNLPGKYGMVFIHRPLIEVCATHFWVDRIWTKPLLDVTFLQDTAVVRQNT